MTKLEKNLKALSIAKLICKWMCIFSGLVLLAHFFDQKTFQESLIQIMNRGALSSLIGYYLAFKVIDSIIEIIEELKTTI